MSLLIYDDMGVEIFCGMPGRLRVFYLGEYIGTFKTVYGALRYMRFEFGVEL